MTQSNIEDIYPLSPMQQGMLFHSLYEPESGMYFEQVSCKLTGRFNQSAFDRAWIEVVRRHAILRTSFMWDELDEPLQIVHRDVRLTIQYLDWQFMDENSQVAKFEDFLQRDYIEGFDLGQPPLMRLAVICTAPNEHRLVWSHHHLLLDGWSTPLLLKEVFGFYEAFTQGQNLYLRPVRPYRDYIAFLEQQNLAQAEQFWRESLTGFQAPTPLVIDQVKRSSKTYSASQFNIRIHSAVLDQEHSQELRKLAQQHGLTLNTWIQGAYGLLLNRYSNETDICFGATVAGRPPSLPGSEEMVGMFINTLPIRLIVDKQQSVLDWLKANQSRQAVLHQFQYSALVKIQSWSEIPPSQPLFKSILVFENYPVESSLLEQRGSLQIRDVRHKGKTNYPLTVVASPGMPFEIQFVYDVNMIDPDAIERMGEHIIQILRGMIAGLDQPTSSISMIGSVENQRIINFADSGAGLLTGETIVDLIEAQVARTPLGEAAISPQPDSAVLVLSYAELNRRANSLAGYLIKSGIRLEDRVGICVERSFELLISMLAVLKAGCAYVPLDPSYPDERLAFMIQDAGLSMIITQSPFLELLGSVLQKTSVSKDSQTNTRVLDINSVTEDEGFVELAYKVIRAGPNNAAYVIYTSGSTGQPKGVVIEHRSLANHAQSLVKEMDLSPGDRIGQWVSISFDAAGEEIYPTLISGATVVLPGPGMETSGWNILKVAKDHVITHLHMPAPVWHQVVDELVSTGEQTPASVRVLLVGGETPSIQRLIDWNHAQSRSIKFINAYGPTEATITSLVYSMEIPPSASWLEDIRVLPIGRALPGATVYLFDADGRLVPAGIPGEITLGGIGLAREYLNQPVLTASKFIQNPSGVVSERLYRTGDLGRYIVDEQGKICAVEFLGRLDNQVKLRGFRIELEEIERALLEAGVDEAAVILREDRPGDKRLVAYYSVYAEQVNNLLTDTSTEGRDVDEIRMELRHRLPEYMIPSGFIKLDEMPHQPNGKIDRRSLASMPAPELPYLNPAGERYAAPRTAVEQIIVGLWSDVLEVDSPGIYDNFFELGGHSLRATQLLSRIRQVFQVEIPLRSLFELPTIAGMAQVISLAMSEEPSIAPDIRSLDRDPNTGVPVELVSLSFPQLRLWFLDQLDPGNLSYNIPAAVMIKGELDLVALEKSINALIQRHEILRTTFADVDGNPVQVITPNLAIDLRLQKFDISDNYADESITQHPEVIEWIRQELQRLFNLANGPLLRVAIAEVMPDAHILVFTLHHIIADGWSLGILIKEVIALYTGFHQGLPINLPGLPVQYADYSTWQREWMSDGELERQLGYWKDQMAGSPPLLDLPTDRPRPAVKTFNGAIESFSLSAELTSKITELIRQEGVTAYMFLLAAFQTLLFRYSAQDDICVGSAIANRTRPEIEGLIGFFVNTLVFRTDLSGGPSFRELLQRVRDVALGAYAHQDLPFETLVEALQPERNLSYTPIFQVGFDWQEVVIKGLELPGVRIEPVETHSGTAAYDLLMSINQAQQHVFGSLEYNTDLFDTVTIQRMLGHFERLLTSIVEDPDQSISRINMLSDAERRQLLLEWNSVDAGFQKDSCIHHLFEQHVALHPTAPAVIFRGSSTDEIHQLTYRELNHRTNLLAHRLRDIGVTTDTLVGVYIDRSLDMIVAIIGVLKAGGAYLPLDPSYPVDRIQFMIEDSRINILLTQQVLVDRVIGSMVPRAENEQSVEERLKWIISLDRDWQSIEDSVRKIHGPSAGDNLTLPLVSENLAYVIYTSGSTGKPKGTLLRHRGLCNLVEWQKNAFDITAAIGSSSGKGALSDNHKVIQSRILQFSPFSFDASVWEIFMALANGAALVMSSQEIIANGLELLRLIKDMAVTTVTLPPSVLKVLPAEQVSISALPDLKTVISAGEACTQEIVARWGEGRNFFNAYGPTETTVCASAGLCLPDDLNDPSIGRPISNTHLYIADSNSMLVPVGVPGELLVGGAGVAKGYLYRPEMTDEKFIPNPHANYLRRAGLASRAQERLYRTGDLVKYRQNGDIEFLGRIDHQVKVRGFRIELGEIELCLQQYREVMTDGVIQRLSDLAVIVREDTPGDSRIFAYVVPEFDDFRNAGIESDTSGDAVTELRRSQEATLIASLRQYLREKLPEYMVPSTFIVMDTLPLNPSGKIDRKALLSKPLPKFDRGLVQSIFEAPRNDIESQLCRICTQLLNLEWTGDQSPIGIWDNFFELGGHSLLATQFIAHIRQAFQVEIPLRTLFEHPTVAEMAEEIKKLREANLTSQVPAIRPVAREAHRMRQTGSGLSSSENQNRESK